MSTNIDKRHLGAAVWAIRWNPVSASAAAHPWLTAPLSIIRLCGTHLRHKKSPPAKAERIRDNSKTIVRTSSSGNKPTSSVAPLMWAYLIVLNSCIHYQSSTFVFLFSQGLFDTDHVDLPSFPVSTELCSNWMNNKCIIDCLTTLAYVLNPRLFFRLCLQQ